jgi:hypothetical protein
MFRWLKGTRDVGITYQRDAFPFMEIGYSDSDYGSQHGRRSISGNVFMFGGAAISWMSKRQPCTAASTQEAEYVAVAAATSQALWLRMFMTELGLDSSEPTHIMCDNQAAIKLASDPTHFSATKHIDLKLHFLREHVERGHTAIVYVPTADNLADGFTKVLPYTQFWYLFDSILGLNARDFRESFGGHPQGNPVLTELDDLEEGEIMED